MEKEQFNKEMEKYINNMSIKLSEKQFQQFYEYMNLLIKWNQKINLTAIIEPEEIILKHFIDSITISKDLNKEASIVDVGTGAGFPGIPLKILRSDLEVTLIDSLNKRIIFLEEIIQKLNLSKIEAIHSRVEEFGKDKNKRESFDIATSRAVANISVLSEYMLPLVKINGYCIMMKGYQIESELEQSKKAISILGGKIERIEIFNLPLSNMKRTIIVIKKESYTPNKYPRKAGIPAKNPI